MKSFVIIVIAVIIFFAAPFMFGGTATSVSGLYTTGINSTWLMNTGAGAYVVSNSTVNGNGWIPNSTSSKWISYNSSTQIPNSTYSYTLSFNINGDGGTGSTITNYVAITLTWTSDDTSALYVNNSNTGITQSGWTSTKTVTIDSTTSNLKIGGNTLTVYVSNSGNGVSGLMVTGISASISPHSPVPEVGAWLPVFGAFVIVMWMKIKVKTA